MTPCRLVPASPPFEVTKRFHLQGCDHKFLSPGTKFPLTQRHIAEEEMSGTPPLQPKFNLLSSRNTDTATKFMRRTRQAINV